MEEVYDLRALRKELEKAVGVKGLMNAYQVVAKECDRSTNEVRRWFSRTDSKFYRKPPMEKHIWETLERYSSNRLDRSQYYPKPDFWG